ncbi:GNAT family N-acetyltransferase [Oscillatoria sp. HE19RPO]|uniref:GNAT family N-acetyltransferase n=1 Tax=Oscillatoria sp. HE19RPO TaxID=2954806 RepID=UPI0020C39BA5|nr:GNAT family N-acetyltransferase [Oscillatoria sp. HE19RPO]
MSVKLLLFRVQDQKAVEAELLPLSIVHLNHFQQKWNPRLQPSSEEDSHWDWVKKYQAISRLANYEGYAIECELMTEGLMLLEIDYHRSRLERNKNLVYVDYLATAPWNRPSIQSPPKYRGVGTAMITFAVQRSIELEYKGRVGLHALPEAERFYKNQLNMVNFGPDERYENLTYFEFSKEEALKIVKLS